MSHRKHLLSGRMSSEQLELEAALFSSAKFPSSLVNSVNEMVMLLNPQRQVVYVNRPMLDLLHLDDVSSLLGKRPGEALGCIHSGENPNGCGHSESCEQCGALWAILHCMQEHQRTKKECRLTCRDAAGVHSYNFEVVASPLDWEGKTFTVVALLDTSDQHRRETFERLFFHDVMNTAVSIKGLADWFLHEGEVGELGEDLLHAATQLVGQIHFQRELLQAEKGTLRVSLQDVNLWPLLERVCGAYRPQAESKRVSLNLLPDYLTLHIETDPILLGRVAENMIKNAVEASPMGGEVIVGIRDLVDRAEIWVKNPGLIPRSAQLQLFQRAFSTKGEGRGLGTYSMKLLGENFLKGRIGFESSEKDGTVFRAVFSNVFENVPVEA